MNFSLLLGRLLLTFSLVCCLTGLSAQNKVIYIESDTMTTGETVAISVLGAGLTDVAGIQMTMAWDSSVLQFVGLENIGLGASESSFNQLRLENGRLGFVYTNPTTMGFMVDSARLFTMNFEALTTVSTTTPITFTNRPVDTLLSSDIGTRAPATWRNGQVTVMGSTSTLNVNAEDARLRVHPNPITETSQVEVTLNYGGEATLDVMDASGRLLRRQQVDLTPGRATYRLNPSDFPVAGSYLIRLTTDREQLIRKVVRR